MSSSYIPSLWFPKKKEAVSDKEASSRLSHACLTPAVAGRTLGLGSKPSWWDKGAAATCTHHHMGLESSRAKMGPGESQVDTSGGAIQGSPARVPFWPRPSPRALGCSFGGHQHYRALQAPKFSMRLNPKWLGGFASYCCQQNLKLNLNLVPQPQNHPFCLPKST